MCNRVREAVRSLEKKYKDKVRFNVLSVEGRSDEIFDFDIGQHGTVALDPSGKLVGKLKSHFYGAPELEALIRKLIE